MPSIKKESFVSRNIIAIVMIPVMIGIHYGWSQMQKNRVLVREDEEMELPVVTFAKYCWQKVQGGNDVSNGAAHTPITGTAAVVKAAK